MLFVCKFRALRSIITVTAGFPLAPCLRPLIPAFAIRPFRAAIFTVEARLLLGDELDLRSLGTVHRQDATALQRARLRFWAAPLLGRGFAPQIGGLAASRSEFPFLAHGLAPDTELAREPRPELVLQDGGFYLFDLACLQFTKHERAEGDADEAVHRQAKMLHDAAHFAVLAFAYGDGDPDIIALLAFQRSLDGAVTHPIDGEAAS